MIRQHRVNSIIPGELVSSRHYQPLHAQSVTAYCEACGARLSKYRDSHERYCLPCKPGPYYEGEAR